MLRSSENTACDLRKCILNVVREFNYVLQRRGQCKNRQGHRKWVHDENNWRVGEDLSEVSPKVSRTEH